MFEDLRADLLRFSRSRRLTPSRVLHVALRLYGFQALLAYRLDRWSRAPAPGSAERVVALLARPVSRLMTAYVQKAYDIHLDPSTEIGPGLVLWHFGGIRLRSCRVGTMCTIHHQVCLTPGKHGSRGPQIGDRVWIGPHAKIVGPVRVGDGATIGAGSVVSRDVAPGALVVGNPARLVLPRYDNSAFR